MYSPKIREELIHPLYLYSKHLGQPMTRTVDSLLYQSLRTADLPTDAAAALAKIEPPQSFESYLTSPGIEMRVADSGES